MKSYTVKEVAELLQVNPETVRRWIRDKKLIANKTSNKGGNQILESELRAFLKATPGYATSLSALLFGGVAASAIMVATYATGKAIEASELKKAEVDNKEIVDFIRSEIISHESLVKRKQESIRQIEKEIAAEQERIRELKAILDNIEKTTSSKKIKEEN